MYRLRWHVALAIGLAFVPGVPRVWGQDGKFLDRPLSSWVAELTDGRVPVRRSAVFALGKMGTESAPVVARLVEMLVKDSDPSVREASAFAIGEIGSAGATERSRDALLQALSDRDPKVRRSAAYALGKYGPLVASAAPTLQKSLHDPQPVVRQNAAWALGQLGAKGASAVSDLSQVLASDRDPLVRRDAAMALGKIGRDAHAAVPALLARFRADPDPVVRRTALDALVNVLGKDDTDAVADLRSGLKNSDIEMARNAAFALANINSAEAVEALPILREALKDDDEMTRRPAAAALAKIGEKAVPAVADLAAVLADHDSEVRRSAAGALGTMGRAARPAVPALVKLLLDTKEQEEVRKYAAEAIANIDPNDPSALAGLLQVLAEKGNYRVRHRVVWALARLNDFEQENVLRGLAGTLLEDEPDARLLRYEAAKTLALKLGERVPDKTIDVLLEALRDTNVRIYKGTDYKIGSGGSEKTGETQVKETGAGDWRRIVAVALVRIGKRAAKRPEIMSGLEKMANESFDPEAKKDAAEALEYLKKLLAN
jgi:HEAT repeat protein